MHLGILIHMTIETLKKKSENMCKTTIFAFARPPYRTSRAAKNVGSPTTAATSSHSLLLLSVDAYPSLSDSAH